MGLRDAIFEPLTSYGLKTMGVAALLTAPVSAIGFLIAGAEAMDGMPFYSRFFGGLIVAPVMFVAIEIFTWILGKILGFVGGAAGAVLGVFVTVRIVTLPFIWVAKGMLKYQPTSDGEVSVCPFVGAYSANEACDFFGEQFRTGETVVSIRNDWKARLGDGSFVGWVDRNGHLHADGKVEGREIDPDVVTPDTRTSYHFERGVLYDGETNLARKE